MIPLPDRDRLLLEACLRDTREAVDAAFVAWRVHAHPAAMHGRDLRLMPLLLANLKRFGLDDPSLAWLRGHAKHIWLAGALRLRAAQAGMQVLSAAGIPVVLLKGGALLARWRDDVDNRPMGDFDILVPVERARETVAALRGAGWTGPAPETVTDADLARFHALAMIDRSGNNLDVHWRPSELIADPSLGRGVSSRAEEAHLDETIVRIPGLTDHLFLLLAHAFNDSLMARDDWIAEVALLLRRGRPEAWDWTLFRSLCRRYRLTSWADQALSLSSTIAGLELPAEARPIPPRSAAAMRYENHEIAMRSRSSSVNLADRIARCLGDRARGNASRLRRREPRAALGVLGDAAERRQPRGEPQAVGRLDFDLARDPGGDSFVTGWSVPEQGGRWTDGDRAWFALRVEGGHVGAPFLMRLSLHAHLARSTSRLAVAAWAGERVDHWSFVRHAAPDPGFRMLEGKLADWGGTATAVVALQFQGLPTSAERVAWGVDHRSLGLFLKRIEILPLDRLPTFAGTLSLGDPSGDFVAWRGWSGREPHGRWTMAGEAELKLRLPEPPAPIPHGLRLVIPSVFSADGQGQRITITSNEEIVFSGPIPSVSGRGGPGATDGGSIELAIPTAQRRPGVVLTLRLRISEPCSPASIGLSDDQRRLGIALSSIDPLI